MYIYIHTVYISSGIYIYVPDDALCEHTDDIYCVTGQYIDLGYLCLH